MSEDAYNNGLDYELSEPTQVALAMFAEGNREAQKHYLQTGQEMPEGALAPRLEQFLNWLNLLSDFDKGIMVIDLLTLTDILGQAITVMKASQIEEGLKDVPDA